MFPNFGDHMLYLLGMSIKTTTEPQSSSELCAACIGIQNELGDDLNIRPVCQAINTLLWDTVRHSESGKFHSDKFEIARNGLGRLTDMDTTCIQTDILAALSRRIIWLEKTEDAIDLMSSVFQKLADNVAVADIIVSLRGSLPNPEKVDLSLHEVTYLEVVLLNPNTTISEKNALCSHLILKNPRLQVNRYFHRLFKIAQSNSKTQEL
jgi:hypothetical protein